jgi:murein DD-endopeptidase MepM/ murein hydrolase activator NlpD
MTSRLTRRGAAALLLALALLAVAAAGSVSPLAQPARAATTDASSPVGDPAHPYSDPVWLPLHQSAGVSCVVTNCPGPYHGHWAIDFIASHGDPVYAAGAGVFHVGAVDRTCPTKGVTAGTWAWVDHGAGGVTRYHHLDSLVAKEGQLVTPATVIGTVGHWGQQAPCHTNYLHFEVRSERLSGPFTAIGTLNACDQTARVRYPSALGYASWDDIPKDTKRVASTGTGCMPAAWSSTPTRPSVVVQRGSHAITLTPSARPAGTDAVRVRLEHYHPSLKKYLVEKYRTIPASQRATTFGGLTDGHTYRLTASYHNAAGWSAWASTKTAVPASVPQVPRYRFRYSSATSMSFGWYRSTSPGTAAATYQVARRCLSSGHYGRWVYTTVPTPAISYLWRNQRHNLTCQGTVRAHNSVGWSGWSGRYVLHTTS